MPNLTWDTRVVEQFISAWRAVAGSVKQTAIDKGWWEKDRNDGEIIALMHSELSEALEGLRHGNPPSDKIPQFTAAEEEGADLVIRLMDWGETRGHRFAEAILAKALYNESRSYKHGGKQF